MTLQAGTRLGPYEILSPLGAGGMGEVYRARDTRLDRDVALKVLSTLLADSPEALARFEREAKAVAALSHANIVALYDFGSSNGTLYAASELLEGETLRARMAEGALPTRKAVEIAVQIAQGLAAAHDKGIVHRDLKPENVFLTKAGPAKILDFGLARQTPLASRGGEDTHSPTIERATDPGTVLGTVGYMSPEQVRGKLADHRSDIFSFGSVLYEMLTGRRAFQAASPAETMAAIAREDPPEISNLAPGLTLGLEHIVRHCLEKNPEDRFQSARDLAFNLLSLSSVSAPQKAQEMAGAFPKRQLVAIGGAIALFALGAASYAWRSHRGNGSRGAATQVRYSQLTEAPGEERHPRLSPDGETLLYVSRAAGNEDIYSLRVGGHNAINLTADSKDDDWAPAFSFDGKQIAFRSEREGGGIFIMGATGESVRRLTDFGYDPAWSPDGEHLVVATEGVRSPTSRIDRSELWIISVADGSKRLLSKGDAVRPVWSPDGGRIAFVRSFGTPKTGLWTMPASGPVEVVAMPATPDQGSDYFPEWSGDGRFLYFASVRSGLMNLWRVAIDEKSGKPSGPPEPINVTAEYALDFGLSRDGKRIAYESWSGRSTVRSIPFDVRRGVVAGSAEELWSSSRDINAPRLSPDKAWITFSRTSAGLEGIAIARLDGTGLRQLTESVGDNRWPRFSPDGKRVAFFSGRGGGSDQIWEIHTDGSSLKKLPDLNGHSLYFPLYSRDGSRLEAVDEKSGSWVLDLTRLDAKWTPVHKPSAGDLEVNGIFSWSRDGRFFAGDFIDQSYRPIGIFIESVETGERRRLTETGQFPVWLSDNRRLLYSRQGAIWVIDSVTGKTSEIVAALKPPRRLVHFEIAPDESFLLIQEDMSDSDIWFRSEQ
jgi:Tol biopolymer transport system component